MNDGLERGQKFERRSIQSEQSSWELCVNNHEMIFVPHEPCVTVHLL